jgi:hypothetical protein
MEIGFKQFHGVTEAFLSSGNTTMQITQRGESRGKHVALMALGTHQFIVEIDESDSDEEVIKKADKFVRSHELNLYNAEDELNKVAGSLTKKLGKVFSDNDKVEIDVHVGTALGASLNILVYLPDGRMWQNSDTVAYFMLHGPSTAGNTFMDSYEVTKLSIHGDMKYRKIKAKSLADLEKKVVAWFDKNKKAFMEDV